MYFIKAPWWLKKLYPVCVFNIPVEENILYLTFDDGPHEEATPYVLDTLKQFNAKATFFCIGKNVEANPELYKRILDEGHRTGNHTFNHLNGWKVTSEEYINNIIKARDYIDSSLFRPPYGRITKFQMRLLSKQGLAGGKIFDIIMWDVLSADFDISLTAEQCTKNVISKSVKGSVITFHDSKKAFPRMKESLLKTLEHFGGLGYRFEAIPI